MEREIIKLVRRLNPKDYHDGYLAGLQAAQATLAGSADLPTAQVGLTQTIQQFEHIRQGLKAEK
ncbi:MAG TPA: hypothetical protein VKD23_21620 [Terriglobales bacterium]|nr:hypothetical protein [Terriglobales bacterium]